MFPSAKFNMQCHLGKWKSSGLKLAREFSILFLVQLRALLFLICMVTYMYVRMYAHVCMYVCMYVCYMYAFSPLEMDDIQGRRQNFKREVSASKKFITHAQ